MIKPMRLYFKHTKTKQCVFDALDDYPPDVGELVCLDLIWYKVTKRVFEYQKIAGMWMSSCTIWCKPTRKDFDKVK